MTTEEIARALKLTAQLMELHGENPFKVKSLSNAAFKLDKTNVDLENKSLEELEKIEGIGKGIAQKINELQTTGSTKELTDMLAKTPVGVIEMMGVKGIGPKKVAQLWKELEIESMGELLYACKENRLVTLKGFGEKTQDLVKKAIEFKMSSAGKYLYASVEQYAFDLVKELKKKFNTELVSLTGAMRRKCEIIEQIDILIAHESVDVSEYASTISVKLNFIFCNEKEFYFQLFKTTGSQDFTSNSQLLTPNYFSSEEEIFTQNNLQYIEPELRESAEIIQLAREHKIPKLIEVKDLKGILHNHTTYSDGANTLREMAEYCKELGYQYLGICDHSQSAFYASGLKPERVIQQQKEIDELNKELAPFKIFKGIESDILYDGSLDYNDEVLKSFDFVVASVHSVLKMDEEKANSRLIKAIENPYTTILGHPTGRLLLSREGYPINHKKIIDACAANGVVVELNANPHRLDIDWRWIQYCIQKNVMISINPDAHERQGFLDMYFGTCAARKGMLTKEMCYNALSLEQIENMFKNKRK